MKRLLLLAVVLSIASPTYGQTITLGTSDSATNPQRSGQAGTGLFSSASNAVSISSGGTEMMRVNGTGVGIGTTSPQVPLDVPTVNTTSSILRTGTMEFSSYALNNSFFGDNVYYNGSTFTRRQTGNAGLFYFYEYGGVMEGQFRLYSSGSGSTGINSSIAQLKTNQDGSFAVGPSVTTSPGSYSGATFLVNSSGDVGIGTIAPPNSLSVSPIQYSTGTASQSGTTVTGSGTSWTSAMIGSQLVYANGVSSGAITAVGSTTSLTATTSQTVASQAYTINYTGLQVTSTGSVGIGNTSPGALLDIGAAGTTLGTMRLEGNTSGYVQIQPAAAAGSWTMTLPSNAGTSGYVLQTNGSGVTSWASAGSGGTITLGTSASATNPQRSGDATTGLFSSTSGAVSISSAGTEMMRVNGTGLGIGTTSPANLLDVGTGGGVHIASGVPGSTSMALYNNSGTLTWNGAAISTGGSSISGTTNYVPYFTSSTSLGNSVIYQSGSKIGIGTTSPSNILSLSGTSAQTFWMERGTAAGNNLTVQAGGGLSGGSNENGGNLILAPGITTGEGGSEILFESYSDGASGTSDNTEFTALTLWTIGGPSEGEYTALEGASFSGTNQDGGTLLLLSGTSTGTGTSSIQFNVFDQGSSGSTTNEPITPLSISGQNSTTGCGANGCVGVGTLTPAVSLDVSQNTDALALPAGTTSERPSSPINGEIRYNSTTAKLEGYVNGAWAGVGSVGGTTNYFPYFTSSTALGNSVIYQNGSSVGLGTTSPLSTFDVETTTANTSGIVDVLDVFANSTGTVVNGFGPVINFTFGDIHTTNNTIGAIGAVKDVASDTGDLVFYTTSYSTSTEKMRILSNGYVGIGTTSPAQQLEVAGQVQIDSWGVIGATTTVCESGNVLALCSSSIRFKENVKNFDRGLDDLMRMRPVKFKWKGRDENDFGLIAEEVRDIDPLYVTYHDGQIVGVKYPQLTAVIVNAVKEQQQEIADLKQEIADLKAAIRH